MHTASPTHDDGRTKKIMREVVNVRCECDRRYSCPDERVLFIELVLYLLDLLLPPTWPARCRRAKNDEDKDEGMGTMAHPLKGIRFLSRNMY